MTDAVGRKTLYTTNPMGDLPGTTVVDVHAGEYNGRVVRKVECEAEQESAQRDQYKDNGRFLVVAENGWLALQGSTGTSQPRSTLGQESTSQEEETTVEQIPVTGMSLVDLAAKLQSNNVDRVPVQESKVVAVETGTQEADVAPMASNKPAPSAEELQALRDEAAQLHTEALKLFEQAELLPMAATVLRDAARKLQRQAEQKEKEAIRRGKSLNEPAYLFEQASALRASLVIEHGSAILAHVEALLKAGILGMSHGVLTMNGKRRSIAVTDSSEKRVTAPRSSDNDERNARIIALFKQGKKASEIVDAMGLQEHPGVVAGLIHRYNTQLAKSIAA